MNKKGFIEKIKEKLNLDDLDCLKINNIVEDTFFIGKKNKEKMIHRFIDELNIDENRANEIYEVVMNIINSEIKDKLKHPFRNLDKN